MLIDQLPPITQDRFWDPPLKVALAVMLICLLAPIQFSASENIPITLQSLIILIVPMILGAFSGTISVGLYLVAGFIGLPVFAGGTSGIEKLWGPTGGFLVGFLVAAWLVGRMAESSWGLKWINIALTLLAGHQVILLLGFLWLGFMSGFSGLMEKVYPLLPGLYIKVIVGTILVIIINELLKILKKNQQLWE